MKTVQTNLRCELNNTIYFVTLFSRICELNTSNPVNRAILFFTNLQTKSSIGKFIATSETIFCFVV